MKKLLKYLYYTAALGMLLTVSSAAYIDPSAMTYIIQIIAGVAIAAGAAFGFYWRRIKRLFSRKKDNVYVADDDDDDDDDFGMDDYALPDTGTAGAGAQLSTGAQSGAAAAAQAQPSAAASAAVPSAGVPTSAPGAFYATDEIPEPPLDKYDEGSSTEALLRENRELRRMLAAERQKVEDLRRAIHICTEGK